MSVFGPNWNINWGLLYFAIFFYKFTFLRPFEFKMAKLRPPPWNDISMGFKHLHCYFITFQWPYEFKIVNFRPPEATGMIFQWGPNTWIANSSHSYGHMSSKLKNSGHHSPFKWYFTFFAHSYGLMSSKCKILATIANWNDISMGSKHLHCCFCTFLWPYGVQKWKILATIAHWSYILTRGHGKLCLSR